MQVNIYNGMQYNDDWENYLIIINYLIKSKNYQLDNQMHLVD